MNPEQLLIGGTTAAMCLAGLWHQGWLLEHTRKGQRLVAWCGSANAAWLLRLLLAAGLGFGVMLAIGVINPLRHPTMSADGER
ncbi:MAG: hypothetical protein KDA75_18680 [Planctomycetaceae bacterium]|nr:hypothetical protein [Planctomycetaceae bacterium]